MTPVIPVIPREAGLDARQRLRSGLLTLVLVLLPALGVAGGLGLAPAMAVLGIAGILIGLGKRGSARRGGERVPLDAWVWALLALALWAGVSSLWSPYDLPGGLDVFGSNPVKLLLGVPLYVVAAGSVLHAAGLQGRWFQGLALGALGVLVALSFVDVASGHGISLMVDPVGAGEDPERRRGDAEMNVGHGLTLALLLLPAGVLGLARRFGDAGIAVAGLLVGMAMLAANLLNLWVMPLGLIVVGVLMGLAYVVPRASVALGFAGAVASLVLAPLVGWVAERMPDATKGAMPFSWEHRLDGWAYVAGRVGEAPLFGHGFDAVRTFDATKTVRGYDLDLVSLHPHNAGLHVWVETGLVGIGLAVAMLVLLGRMALRWTGGDRVRAAAVAGLVGAATVVGSISYGVWQEWWWASLFLAGALVPVMLRRT